MTTIRACAKLGVSFDSVSQVLQERSEEIVPGPPEADGSPVLEVWIGDTVVERPVEFHIEDYVEVRRPTIVGVIPFEIKALHGSSHYPVFEAELEVTPTSHATVEVALEGRYRPPGGLLGVALDAAALHRVGEKSIDRWFRGFVERLRANAANRDAMSGVPV